MNDVYEVLRQKELDIERVQREIAALRYVVPLLADDGTPQAPAASNSGWARILSRVLSEADHGRSIVVRLHQCVQDFLQHRLFRLLAGSDPRVQAVSRRIHDVVQRVATNLK
jgi:hypothetical protein